VNHISIKKAHRLKGDQLQISFTSHPDEKAAEFLPSLKSSIDQSEAEVQIEGVLVEVQNLD
jgi:hypothetical protein